MMAALALVLAEFEWMASVDAEREREGESVVGGREIDVVDGRGSAADVREMLSFLTRFRNAKMRGCLRQIRVPCATCGYER